jgi:hypothetical protein
MKIAHDMDRVFVSVGLPHDKYGIQLVVKGKLRRPKNAPYVLTRKEWRELGWKPLPWISDVYKLQRYIDILNREHLGITPKQAGEIGRD